MTRKKKTETVGGKTGKSASAKATKAVAKKTMRKAAKTRVAKTAGDTGAPRPLADRSAVRVRMYRHGLGDCFLLSLPAANERPFYLMIDCGIILGTKEPGPLMKSVVKDIIDVTHGEIDLLVVTHEHWDHLSGFLQAKELFAAGSDVNGSEKLRIRDLWLAWTEDPHDDVGTLLRSQRKKAEQGLRMGLQSLRAAELERAPARGAAEEEDETSPRWITSEQVESLLSFFGAAGSGTTADALQALQTYARNPSRYCRPSDPPVEIENVPGIRIYTLGPPRDEKLIKKSRPSTAHPEVYEMTLGLTPDASFFAATAHDLAALDGSSAEGEFCQPFDSSFRIPHTQAQQWPFFQRYYWGDAAEDDYRDQSWRRIDADWLSAATELALKLDEDTNNTSLVLAIELVRSGKVLLFAGDAQVGNWLSWENLSWTVDGRKVTAHDLLARTVLYKVGHHGSHNATLREKGLELMKHPELAAMIPVDHAMAVKKRWSQIPFDPLLKRLAEKTGGRVMRSDNKEKIRDQDPPPGVAPAFWNAYKKRVTETELYFEYEIVE
jgi:hypothetical protein